MDGPYSKDLKLRKKIVDILTSYVTTHPEGTGKVVHPCVFEKCKDAMSDAGGAELSRYDDLDMSYAILMFEVAIDELLERRPSSARTIPEEARAELNKATVEVMKFWIHRIHPSKNAKKLRSSAALDLRNILDLTFEG